MKVVSLLVKRKKGGNIERIEEGYLKEDYGLLGDINGTNRDRQISIATDGVRKYIEKDDSEGICNHRFYENITIEGLDTERLHIGQKIIIGETVQEITSLRKSCFPECKLIASKNPCPLRKEVVFTRVIKEGPIKIGDKVGIINHKNIGDKHGL